MIEPEVVEQRIKGAFPDGNVELTDLTGTKDHYQAVVISQAFAGKTRVQQHQMVYAALGELMDGPVHALALETRVP